MTIEGAIAELQNLINNDDVPFYYNGVIKKGYRNNHRRAIFGAVFGFMILAIVTAGRDK